MTLLAFRFHEKIFTFNGYRSDKTRLDQWQKTRDISKRCSFMYRRSASQEKCFFNWSQYDLLGWNHVNVSGGSVFTWNQISNFKNWKLNISFFTWNILKLQISGWMNESIGAYTCTRPCGAPTNYSAMFDFDWTEEGTEL